MGGDVKLATMQIKRFDDRDDKNLIQKLKYGDFKGAIQIVDRVLNGANNDNIDEYIFRIWGITNCILKCSYSITDNRNKLKLINSIRHNEPFDKQYSWILHHIQSICSNTVLSYTNDTEAFVQNVENYISGNYASDILNVTTMSMAMQCSPDYLNKKFKSVRHMTIGKYLLLYRIDKAKEFIAMSSMKISTIATRCGFTSVRTFNRSFVESVGMTPRDYKKIKMAESVKNRQIYRDSYQSSADYGKGVCNSIMKQYDARYLPPCIFIHSRQVSAFTYRQGTLLKGMLDMYSVCNEESYIKYAKRWVDATLDDNMNIITAPGWGALDSLDFRQAGILMFDLYDYTKDTKYIDLAKNLVESLSDYPTNEFGGYYHNATLRDQMWLGDTYTAGPVCALYSKYTEKTKYCDMAIRQIEIMWKNMRDDEGLLRHGWDHSKTAIWADPQTGLSPVVWGRALGFFLVSVIDIIDCIEDTHPKKNYLIGIIKTLIPTVVSHQSKTGGWYQIINKPNLDGNWIETSATCLILYAMAKAYRLKYIDETYLENIRRGFEATMDMMDFSQKGYPIIKNTSIGLHVDTESNYLQDKIGTNDLHGIGTFTSMCSEMSKIGL